METNMGRSFNASAYGGEGRRARSRRHIEELGIHWAACVQGSEREISGQYLYTPQVKKSSQNATSMMRFSSLLSISLRRRMNTNNSPKHIVKQAWRFIYSI